MVKITNQSRSFINCWQVLFGSISDLLKSKILTLEAKVDPKMSEIDYLNFYKVEYVPGILDLDFYSFKILFFAKSPHIL